MLPAALTVIILLAVLVVGITMVVSKFNDQDTTLANLARDITSIRSELQLDVDDLERRLERLENKQ